MFAVLNNIKITSHRFISLALLSAVWLSGISLSAQAEEPRETLKLDENCVVNILNRTVQSDENVPSSMGNIRARATCTRDGKTISGETDYFSVINNGKAHVGQFYKTISNIPVSVSLINGTRIILTVDKNEIQLLPLVTYPDGQQKIIQKSINGINYTSTNTQVVSVDSDGLLTGNTSGIVLLSIRIDGVVTTATIVVNLTGDTDGDGIPDGVELQYGMDPNDPVDAFEDQDNDGISALDEYNLGTDPTVVDTDGDGISDGEEIVAGEDGFITNPLLSDSDGDGINDGLEILIGSDPTNENSGNLANALNYIRVTPTKVFINYNSIDGEGSVQLKVTGHMLDGSWIDLTSTSRGTNYQSNDLSIVNFGSKDGQIFAGKTGSAQVTVTSNALSYTVDVETSEFKPVTVSAIQIPGYANNVDVQGNYAYIAAGAHGKIIINHNFSKKL